jgi:hypothetical protein
MHAYTMEYQSAIKKQNIKGQILYDSIHEVPKTGKFIETKSRKEVIRSLVVKEEWGILFDRKFQFGKMEKFWK